MFTFDPLKHGRTPDASKPWETQDLVEHRAHHRRILAMVDEFIVRGLASGRLFSYAPVATGEQINVLAGPVDLPDHERAAGERMLRGRADSILETESVQELLKRMDEAVAGAAIERFLDQQGLIGVYPSATLTETAVQAKRKRVRNFDKEEGAAELVDAVFHLLLADVFAGDGYADPRLAQTEPFAAVVG